MLLKDIPNKFQQVFLHALLRHRVDFPMYEMDFHNICQLPCWSFNLMRKVIASVRGWKAQKGHCY